MKIVHISDTHGSKQHSKLIIPECDVIVHTGDIGGRTNLFELMEFLEWFSKLPAKVKIFIAGNHDLILDADFIKRQKDSLDSIAFMLLEQSHKDAINLIKQYNVVYLNGSNKDYVYNGIKFWGNPYSPSFHRAYWAFNADRGDEIKRHWSKMPSDVNILLTHSPVYGVFDDVKECKSENEMDAHVGCKDLMDIIKKRLFALKLHCCGHIHDNYGIAQINISNSRRCLFSNGSVLNNQYELLIKEPIIINI
jgi:Icc-related predicted phosphoesterase